MTIQYALYQRPLKIPFRNGAFIIQKREGILFRSKKDDHFLYSEAAPLPPLSIESIESLLINKKAPSLSLALENLKQPLTFKYPVSLSALIDLNTPIKEAFHYLQNNFQTLKFKISPSNIEWRLKEISELKNDHPQVKIRLDANSSFTLNEIKPYLQFLEHLDLEYLEDPVSNPEEVMTLSRLTKIPLALDKELGHLQKLEMYLNLPFSYYIIKPSLIGKRSLIENTIQKIIAYNKKFIFSSLFETEIGLRSLYLLASQYPQCSAHGLNTQVFFTQTFIPEKNEIIEIPLITKEEEQYLNTLQWADWPYATN